MVNKGFIVEEDKDKGEIYIISCKVNDKIYIGKAKCVRLRTENKNKEKDTKQWYKSFGSKGRFKEHIREAESNKADRRNTVLNNAIRKHRPENFFYQVIHKCPLEEMDHWESYYIKKYYSTDRDIGYNMTDGGDGGDMTPEVREKISNTVKRLWDDPIYREKQLKAFKNRKREFKATPNHPFPYIYKYKEVGYKVQLMHNSKSITEYYIRKENTLDQNLESAKEGLETLKKRLGII